MIRLFRAAAVVLLAVILVSVAHSHRPDLHVQTPALAAGAFSFDPSPPPTEAPVTTVVSTEPEVAVAPPPDPPPVMSPVVSPSPPPNNNAITPTGCAYEALIRSVFVEDPDTAVAIAWRESNCQPGAYNPSGASGLFQLMMPLHAGLFASVGCSPMQWSDPVCNVNAAHVLYLGSSWGPWAL